jgi:hypothetical protein
MQQPLKEKKKKKTAKLYSEVLGPNNLGTWGILFTPPPARQNHEQAPP